jgi:signal transduction histidine kinase
MINDLLDYSREIRLDLTETTPKALLKDALSLVKVPKKTRIIDSTEEAPIVSVDAGRITRVFVNIIKNAIDAMPDGGTLIVTSKADEDNSTVTFTDTGMGMSKETLSKLWTTLFTTKAKEMGFGLPICKRVVEAHGGKIALVSTEGKGTTVTITIPITSEPTTGSKAQIFNEYAETMIT